MSKMLEGMTEENRAKANETRKKGKEILKKHGYQLTMAKAIRANCLDCQGAGAHYVKNCDLISCALWPFRMGKNPRDEHMMVAQFSPEGNIIGHVHRDELP